MDREPTVPRCELVQPVGPARATQPANTPSQGPGQSTREAAAGAGYRALERASPGRHYGSLVDSRLTAWTAPSSSRVSVAQHAVNDASEGGSTEAGGVL